jgi:hypothetical protein
MWSMLPQRRAECSVRFRGKKQAKRDGIRAVSGRWDGSLEKRLE